MNVDKMEAGRLLDAEIAERVMGWTRYPEKMDRTDNRTINDVLYCPPEMPYDKNALNVVPNYSTDIAAAWEVVEKLRADGWALFIQSESSGWSVEIARDVPVGSGGVCVSGDELAPTFPLTLCRAACYVSARVAALLAVPVSEGEIDG